MFSLALAAAPKRVSVERRAKRALRASRRPHGRFSWRVRHRIVAAEQGRPSSPSWSTIGGDVFDAVPPPRPRAAWSTSTATAAATTPRGSRRGSRARGAPARPQGAHAARRRRDRRRRRAPRACTGRGRGGGGALGCLGTVAAGEVVAAGRRPASCARRGTFSCARAAATKRPDVIAPQVVRLVERLGEHELWADLSPSWLFFGPRKRRVRAGVWRRLPRRRRPNIDRRRLRGGRRRGRSGRRSRAPPRRPRAELAGAAARQRLRFDGEALVRRPARRRRRVTHLLPLDGAARAYHAAEAGVAAARPCLAAVVAPEPEKKHRAPCGPSWTEEDAQRRNFISYNPWRTRHNTRTHSTSTASIAHKSQDLSSGERRAHSSLSAPRASRAACRSRGSRAG